MAWLLFNAAHHQPAVIKQDPPNPWQELLKTDNKAPSTTLNQGLQAQSIANTIVNSWRPILLADFIDSIVTFDWRARLGVGGIREKGQIFIAKFCFMLARLAKIKWTFVQIWAMKEDLCDDRCWLVGNRLTFIFDRKLKSDVSCQFFLRHCKCLNWAMYKKFSWRLNLKIEMYV